MMSTQTAVRLSGIVVLSTALCLFLCAELYRPTSTTPVHIGYRFMGQNHTDSPPTSMTVDLVFPWRSLMNTFPLTLPHGDALIPIEVLRGAPWVNALRAYLNRTMSNQVTVVTVDWSFVPNLLNWLIFAVLRAQIPAVDIVVVALDERVHRLMESKGLSSVYISRESVIAEGVKMQSNWSHIWITRCLVFRILNHWGFDVATYDVDAIPLRNLQPKYDEHPDSNLIGSFGVYPFPLHRKWGVTVCMGVALFRSSEFTAYSCKLEQLWDSISAAAPGHYDDQVKLNTALDQCNISWTRSLEDGSRTGRCQTTGLRVTVLPSNVICRSCKLKRLSSYYVWHQRGSRNSSSKVEKAQQGGAWLLRRDWAEGGFSGVEWLRQISSLGMKDT